jgi:hypothetical protein
MKKQKTPPRWSRVHISYFRRAALAAKLPIKRRPSKPQRGSRMRADLWSAAQDAYLRKHAAAKTNERLAADLPGRTVTAVKHRLRALGLVGDREREKSKHPKPRRYTDADRALMKALYKKGVPIARIAERLRRTESNVGVTLFRMGLTGRKAKPYSAAEIRIARAMVREHGLDAVRPLAKKLGRPVGSVKNMIAAEKLADFDAIRRSKLAERDRKVVEMWNSKEMTMLEVAKAAKLARKTVEQIVSADRKVRSLAGLHVARPVAHRDTQSAAVAHALAQVENEIAAGV